MSAELSLTDAELLALQKCIAKAQELAGHDETFWQPGEAEAALSAYRKLTRGLDRASRRRTR
jgi:hypothetical protein